MATFAATLVALLSVAASAQAANPPVVQDDGAPVATSATSEAAQTLVDPQSDTTTVCFQYGTDPTYADANVTKITSCQTVSGGGVVVNVRRFTANNLSPVSGTLTPLTPGTYYERAMATNSGGTTFGTSWTFVAGAPQAITDPVAANPAPTTTSAKLQGEVGPAGQSTTYYFQYASGAEWSANPSVYPHQTASQGPVSGSGLQAVSFLLTGQPSGPLHYQLVAVNGSGTSSGQDQNVTLGAASAYADPPTPVSGAQETLNGRVDPGGLTTTYYFDWGTDTSYTGGPTSTQTAAGTTAGIQQAESAMIGGLTVGQTYHYQMVATNAAGTVRSTDQTFVAGQPSLDSTSPAPYQNSSAAETLTGNVNPGGLPTTFYFQYGGQDLRYTVGATAPQSLSPGTNPVDVQDTVSAGLVGGQTYHYRIVATNQSGTYYSGDNTFTFDQSFANTAAATSVTSAGATFNGQAGAGNQQSTVSFQYGTDQSVGQTAAANPGTLASGSGYAAVPVTATISGVAGTTYYYRAVVTNVRTFYGQIQKVTLGASATTRLPTAVGDTFATLHGHVDPAGADTTYQFDYGTTAAYGSTAGAGTALAASGPVDIAFPIAAGLQPNTVYHYRIEATQGSTTVYGRDETFTTLLPPSATTGSPSGVAYSAAVISGTVTPNGFSTQYYFQYATTAEWNSNGGNYYPHATAPVDAGSGNAVEAESAQLSGLLGGSTTYHFRMVATDNVAGVQPVYGADNTFTTTPTQAPPTVNPPSIPAPTDTTATLNTAINPQGLDTNYFVEYSTDAYFTANPGAPYGNPATPTASTGSTPSTPIGSGSLDVPVTVALSSLVPGTLYHYAIVATGMPGSVTTTRAGTFSTPQPPTATTIAATSDGTPGPGNWTLTGTVNPNGYATNAYFQYATAAEYTSSGYPHQTSQQAYGSGTADQPATATLSAVGAGLAPGTLYHYRLVANNGSVNYGTDLTFTTPSPPVVTTDPPPSPTTNPPTLTDTTAALSGTVNPSAQSTTYRFDYATSAYFTAHPTAPYSTTVAGTGPPLTGAADKGVATTLTSLVPGTTYHYRLWASNTAGPTSGLDQTFTTPVTPTGATGTAATVSSSGAVLNGTVNPNGFATNYYFQYATDAEYALAPNNYPHQTAPQPASPTNPNVTAQLRGLSPNTKYHFRLVATDGGTFTGADQTFTTIAPPAPNGSTTPGASNVTNSGMTLLGFVDGRGYPTTYYFQYGTTAAYGSSTSPQGPVSGATAVSADIAGLAPGTTYHYCLVATSSGGSILCVDQTAITAGTPPGTGGGTGGGTAGGTGGGTGGGGTGGTGGGTGSGAAPTIAVSGPPKETLSATNLVLLDPGLKVSCPAAASPCQVTIPVTIVIPGKLVRASRHKKATRTRAQTITLGTGTVTVMPGKATELQITLTHAASTLLKSSRTLHAQVKVTLAGSKVTSTRAVTLIMPRAVPKPKAKPKGKKH